MHSTIDYRNSPAPQHDAVNDIKDYLGIARWNAVSEEMRKVTNCAQFALHCSFMGISGFPVRAWYELYHGEGSWDESALD